MIVPFPAGTERLKYKSCVEVVKYGREFVCVCVCIRSLSLLVKLFHRFYCSLPQPLEPISLCGDGETVLRNPNISSRLVAAQENKGPRMRPLFFMGKFNRALMPLRCGAGRQGFGQVKPSARRSPAAAYYEPGACTGRRCASAARALRVVPAVRPRGKAINGRRRAAVADARHVSP